MWLYSLCFKATAVSGRCYWDSEQSKLVTSYYWVWHQISFSDLSQKVIHRVSSTGREYFEHTFRCFIWVGMKSSLAWNAVFWPNFLFIKVRNYLAHNFTTEDFMIQVWGPLAKYIYGCYMTPVTRGALRYVSYQKGIIQGHIVHRYASRRAPVLRSRIVLRTVLSLDVST